MSREALKWLHTLPSMKPPQRVLLERLCRYHSLEAGCFPGQAKLAAEASISPSSVNTHLKILERKGLIRRVRMKDPKTRRQLPTRYVLAFEDSVPGCADHKSGCANVPPWLRSPDSRKSTKPTPKTRLSRLPNSERNIITESKNLNADAKRSVVASVDDEAFSIEWYSRLAWGPTPETSWTRPTVFQQQQLARQGAEAIATRRLRQATHGFPEAARMLVHARDRKRVLVGVWTRQATGLCEQVTVGSPEAEAWKEEHIERGWPWYDGLSVGMNIYVPKGGLQGLDGFLDRLRQMMPSATRRCGGR